MRKLALLAFVVIAFFLHAKISFSESSVMRLVSQHSLKAMSGDAEACADFREDVTVTLISEGPQGQEEVEGSKAEICEYYEQGAAAFRVLQARINSNYQEVSIEADGFPWLQATVTFTTKSSISAPRIPTLRTSSDDTWVLRRTLTGLKIQVLHSIGHIE